MLRTIGRIFILCLILFALFLLYAKIVEYTPREFEPVAVFNTPTTLEKDTITILSWNIGYAGLGSDMDFFMDGGESSRTSRGRTLENLSKIIETLKQYAPQLDFIALQEVDIKSKRSYEINEYDTIVKRLGSGFESYYAPNFRVFYVPIPLGDPIGEVDGGLMLISRYTPRSATRLAYPSHVWWPQSMFDLKRAMLSLQVQLPDGKTLYVNNTHNSAYDNDAKGRQAELVFINSYLSGKEYSITLGDWNSTPPGHSLSDGEKNDPHFSVHSLSTSDFESGVHIAADLEQPSVRYGYEPYQRGHTTTSIIDFAVSSPRIRPLRVKCLDLGFENSDHNPVLFTFVIEH